jgi:putative endonuclease
MVTNRSNGTLYVGVADDLTRRVWQHRGGLIDGFTKRYGFEAPCAF